MKVREALTTEATETALCRIPVFRPVALELLRSLDDEETGVLEIAELVGSDPALSAEVLISANSAVYGSKRAVNTVAKAIAVVGIDRTRALALRAAMDAMKRGMGKHPTVERAWMHSRATAVVAEWLAPNYRFHPDRAYMAGLLHDIGRLGLLSVDCAAYSELMDNAKDSNRELMAAEKVLFKFDHCEAGLWLTRTWGLPEEFWRVCSDHHLESTAMTEPEIAIAHLSCSLAHALGFKAAPLVTVPELSDLLAQIPNQPASAQHLPGSSLWNRLKEELGVEPPAESLDLPSAAVN